MVGEWLKIQCCRQKGVWQGAWAGCKMHYSGGQMGCSDWLQLLSKQCIGVPVFFGANPQALEKVKPLVHCAASNVDCPLMTLSRIKGELYKVWLLCCNGKFRGHQDAFPPPVGVSQP